MASVDFINECKNRANANRLGRLIIDELETTITQSDRLQSFTIDNGCYIDGNIIGSVYVKKMTGQILDTNEIDLTDKKIKAEIGVKYTDNSTEYISVGTFTVERPKDEQTANISQITAYDDLNNNLDSKYICGIDYSEGNKTLSDLYIDVCKQLNLMPKNIIFDNSTIPIISNPFNNGEKNRVVLQTIAKISGSFTNIDLETNEIDLCWLSQNEIPDYTFYKNDYAILTGGKIKCGPINCLIIKNSQVDDENVIIKDEESITLYGEKSITISEDYILYNAELRQQAINSIWSKVHNMTYVDCKLTTYYGKPFLKLGDKIRIYISDTEYIDTYVLNHTFTYDGTFTSVIESPALTKQEIKTKQDVSLGDMLKNTQIEINKQQGTITNITNQVQTLQDNITNNYYTIEQSNTLIQNATQGLINTLNQTGGTNILRNAIGIFDKEYWNGDGAEPYTDTYIQNKTGQKSCWLLNNGKHSQTIQVKNGTYTFSMMYEKLISASTVILKINDVEYELRDNTNLTFEVTDNYITVEFLGNVNMCAYLMNLMLNEGEKAQIYSNNANETISDTVLIGKGIKIRATGVNTEFDAQADGIRTKNINTGEIITEFTEKGTITNELTANKATISKVLISDTGTQTLFTRL